MNLDRIFNSLTLYISCSVCLGGSLLLWIFSVEKELRMVRSNAKKSYDLLRANVRELSINLDTMRETRQPAEPALSSRTSYPGLDLTKRTEVLRMFQHKEPATAIAKALRLPQNEIELLLKIEGLLHPYPPR